MHLLHNDWNSYFAVHASLAFGLRKSDAHLLDENESTLQLHFALPNRRVDPYLRDEPAAPQERDYSSEDQQSN
jgi:hypothetical protein